MKTHWRNGLIILVASLTVGVSGQPPAAKNAAAFVPPAAGGTMNPGAVGGQMSPGAVAGTLSPGGFLGPTLSGSNFVSGSPGGTLYLGPSGIFPKPVRLAPAGGTLTGSGVGGVQSSVIIAGGNAYSPTGGSVSAGGVGGVNRSVIVTGGTSTASGGTLTPAGTGGFRSTAPTTRSGSSVIVAGGSTN
jgi:hypothetical protein